MSETIKTQEQPITVFDTLYGINVNEHTETKKTSKATLTYLSWAWAWAEVKKRYPNASYEIIKDQNGLPYFSDPQCGIIVYTKVTIDNVTHEMWLPVMDGANNAMRFENYEITTKFGKKTVAAATMFDVNKTVMRCLTKNLAMFGLGLYIYAGEDLPEENEEEKQAKLEAQKALEEDLNGIKIKIDAEVKRITGKMTKEDKMIFANEKIIPVIGQVNYKTCKDKTQLETLLKNLTAA